MIGYFFVLSKSNGFHMLPYRSVTPSAAFTVNVSGGDQPSSFRRETSVVSRSITFAPFSSRNTQNGTWSMRELLSTTNFRDGDMELKWYAGPGSISARPAPSSFTEYRW